jgi:hypothetical protein
MRLAKKFYPKKRELRIWDEDRPTLETFPLDFSDGAFDWGELEEFTTKEEAQDWVDETISDVFGCEKLEVFGFIDIAKYGAVEIEETLKNNGLGLDDLDDKLQETFNGYAYNDKTK